MRLLNKEQSQDEKKHSSISCGLTKNSQGDLFPFLGLALLLHLLLLLQSDVSTKLLICSFICMVSRVRLARQACHP